MSQDIGDSPADWVLLEETLEVAVDAFGLVVTLVLFLGVVVLILLFERPRAARIQRDQRKMAEERREDPQDGSPDK